MPGRDRRGTADRAERLALLARQGRGAPQRRGRARHRKRPAAHLRQPGRRPGRAGVRRRLVRPACRPLARLPAPGLSRERHDAAMGAHAATAGAASTARSRRSRRAIEADYCACMLGLRDYVNKNGFKGVVLGLSGGINSALVAAMAVDALGAERVRCVMLPYRFTSQESLERCRAVAQGARRPLRHGADRKRGRGSREVAGAAVRGHDARRHRGEPAGARARHHPDGDLQQVRPDGGDHRQQVGNVGRLRHALRRHERRLQPDQGSLQDRGLPAGAPAQRLEAG